MQNKFRIALVNPRVESYSSTLPPLGLLYIAAVLEKNGYPVKVFDLYPYDDRDIASLVSFQPRVVGMTVLTDYWTRAQHVSQVIHKRVPDAVCIVGGVHVTALPEESLDKLNADIAVIGEGEYTILELCSCLSRGSDWKKTSGIAFKKAGGGFKTTSTRPYIDNLDELPFPARHLLNFNRYLVPPGMIRGHWSERSTTVMTSRGCPFQCIWCGSYCLFGRKVRYRSIDNVMGEIEQLISVFNIDTIWFIDDTFTLNRKRVMEFCARIARDKIKLTFGCQSHVKTADLDMFKFMKKAGFVQVDFGVESGSDKVLKVLKKSSSAEAVKKAFRLAKSAKLRTMATFMFGSPGEEEADVEASLKLARAIKPDFTSSYFITPYPGTELMDMAVSQGWIASDNRNTLGLKKGPMLKIHFSEAQLLKIRARFQRLFLFRNFFSLLFSPVYVLRAASILIRYPLGVVYGIRKFLKTFVFDDLVFEFLIYYVKKRKS